ncbi:MAG: PrgI family protein [Candidatus Gracilibacteria bacterium]|nr:PrgI family protein [Candidatus Gracilibacteria bacterium]
MQYKIPVQIENEDPILLGLSLRQLTIVMIGFGIGYSIFKSLSPLGTEIAAIPSITIAIIGIFIAIFKYSEMTFIQFILNFIRHKVNLENRKWVKGIDSYSLIDIGFVSNIENKLDNKIDFKEKIEKMKEIEDKLNKI